MIRIQIHGGQCSVIAAKTPKCIEPSAVATERNPPVDRVSSFYFE
ncbi:MAG: hypothetical protein ACN4GF_02230 [Lentimonas sp.]